MKASNFSEAQKAFILKQALEGMPVTDICRKAGINPGDVFQLEAQVRRPPADGDATAKAARGREREAAQGRRRSLAGQGDAAGRLAPKTVKPVCKRGNDLAPSLKKGRETPLTQFIALKHFQRWELRPRFST